MDLDCGYWQVQLDKASRDKTAFYMPKGKKHWMVMLMGATNAQPFFIAMVGDMGKAWNVLAEKRGIKLCSTTVPKLGEDKPDSKTIVDNVLLYAYTPDALIEYFTVVLEVLQHYQVTVKLCKSRFVQQAVKFVGMDILAKGNSPAKSKEEAFHKMTYPKSFAGLQGSIGFIGFYQDFIPLYKVQIHPFRELLKEAPSPGIMEKHEEAAVMDTVWKEPHGNLFDILKAKASSQPLLARLSDEKQFYLQTHWSSQGRGAILAQPNDHPDAIKAMDRELKGSKYEFNATLNEASQRLRPISFISKQVTTKSEKALHSFIGEAGTGVWAVEKYKFYLLGKEFTWIGNCLGLIRFFEHTELPTHQAQRWKLYMHRFDFTIVHRPDQMMKDVGILSQYNKWVREWRPKQVQQGKQTQTH
jgi:hypothetical protein